MWAWLAASELGMSLCLDPLWHFVALRSPGASLFEAHCALFHSVSDMPDHFFLGTRHCCVLSGVSDPAADRSVTEMDRRHAVGSGFSHARVALKGGVGRGFRLDPGFLGRASPPLESL